MWGGGGVKKVYHGSTLVFGKQVFESVFTSSGSIHFPASLIALRVICVGSGGSGGQWGAVSGEIWIGGGGGGAGGYCEKNYTKAEIESIKGKTISFTVGAVPGSTASGNASSFLLQVANGGKAGEYYITQTPGVGGTASGGDVNNQGATGTKGNYYVLGSGGAGWSVAGGTYGGGGPGNSVYDAGLGKVGCVFIRYEY